MRKTIILGLLLSIIYGGDTALCQSTPGAKSMSDAASDRRQSSIQTGDVFRGVAILVEQHHNPAELTLYIRKVTSKDVNASEFDIEAIASMNIHSTPLTYGLKGTYVPSCQQINLYELADTQPVNSAVEHKTVIDNVVFEPVGLAGKFTDDGQTIYCQIAYNGNASLVRIKEPIKFDETLAATVRKRNR